MCSIERLYELYTPEGVDVHDTPSVFSNTCLKHLFDPASVHPPSDSPFRRPSPPGRPGVSDDTAVREIPDGPPTRPG